MDVACVPIGGQLSATRAAEVVAQLDPKIVVPMAVCDDEHECDEALAKFLHEMGAKDTTAAGEADGHAGQHPRGDHDRAAGGARQGLGAWCQTGLWGPPGGWVGRPGPRMAAGSDVRPG